MKPPNEITIDDMIEAKSVLEQQGPVDPEWIILPGEGVPRYIPGNEWLKTYCRDVMGARFT